MMRILILALTVALSFNSFAKTPAPRNESPFPKLLTSRQLLALTPARRMAYFLKLRKMLTELSALSRQRHGTLVADYEAQSEFQAKVEHLMGVLSLLLIDQASAANCSGDFPKSFGSICGGPCAPGQPDGKTQIGQAIGNKYYCFPKADYQKVADKSTLGLPIQNMGDVPMVPPKDFGTVPPAPEPPTTKANDAPISEVIPVTSMPEVKTTTPSMPEIQAQETGCRGSGRDGDLVESVCSGNYVSEKVLAEQEAALKQDRLDMKTADKLAETPPSLEPTGAKPPACQPPKLKCEDSKNFRTSKEWQGALDEFRKSGPKSCIYGGNMSGYQNNEVKAGNCSSVSEFCISKSDCTDTGSASGDKTKVQSKFKCKAGRTICSPFIFGIKNGSEPICVAAKGKFVTESCDKEAAKMKSSNKYVMDFLGKGPNGVADAWDEYADKFNDVCAGGSVSQAAHCEECKIIGKRLSEANLMATGECSTAVHSKDFKPSAPAETTK